MAAAPSRSPRMAEHRTMGWPSQRAGTTAARHARTPPRQQNALTTYVGRGASQPRWRGAGRGLDKQQAVPPLYTWHSLQCTTQPLLSSRKLHETFQVLEFWKKVHVLCSHTVPPPFMRSHIRYVHMTLVSSVSVSWFPFPLSNRSASFFARLAPTRPRTRLAGCDGASTDSAFTKSRRERQKSS